MIKRDKLEIYLRDYLQTEDFDDYCPNGLQAEGAENIEKIVCGVSASIELFEKAIDEEADTILVHHGIIWNAGRPVYKGSYRERVKMLLTHNLNLFAYHLPLDAHAVIGNNIQLAHAFNLKNIQQFARYKGNQIGFKGEIKATAKMDFFNQVKSEINKEPLIFDFGPDEIKTVGIVSGGAQREIEQAVSEKLDVFITGEVSENNYHYAKEEKIHFIAAGHHATETYGVKSLGQHIAEKFNIKVKYIDIHNPV